MILVLYYIIFDSNLHYYPTAANTVQIIVAVIYSVIYTVEHPFPSFTDQLIDYSSCIINFLLDVLICIMPVCIENSTVSRGIWDKYRE